MDAAPATEPPDVVDFARSRQRAQGAARVTFARAGAATRAARVFETGGLRARFPNSGADCEAVLVNTGGGMAGGDVAEIALTLELGARVLATTQSAEKIYRAGGAPVRIETRLSLAAGASLVWAPQETLLFEGSHLIRRLEADVDPEASLTLLESCVFGRLAHGETCIAATFHDDWRLRRGGRLVFAEAVRLDDAGATLDRPAAGDGARALATLVRIAPDAAAGLEPLRAALEAVAAAQGERLEVGASVVDGVLVARALSPSPVRLRAAIVAALEALARPRRRGCGRERRTEVESAFAIVACLGALARAGGDQRACRADLRRGLLHTVVALARLGLLRSPTDGGGVDPRLDRAVRRQRVWRARAQHRPSPRCRP